MSFLLDLLRRPRHSKLRMPRLRFHQYAHPVIIRITARDFGLDHATTIPECRRMCREKYLAYMGWVSMHTNPSHILCLMRRSGAGTRWAQLGQPFVGTRHHSPTWLFQSLPTKYIVRSTPLPLVCSRTALTAFWTGGPSASGSMRMAPHDRAISLFSDETCFLEQSFSPDVYGRARLDKVNTREAIPVVEER